MSLLAGTRVIRGPDWMWGDQDGGDGYLGTITEVELPNINSDDSPPSAVKVTWDSGKKGNYRAGFEGKFDLRIFDNAPTGVCHKNVRCVGCNAKHIAGVCWRCTACVKCNLCTECYVADSHETDHEFLRIDEPHDAGFPVGKRRDALRLAPSGLLPGATVGRGPDWNAANQDGGRKNRGVIQGICDWSYSSKRSGVMVQWKEGETFKYRAGHDGKVEVKATEPAVGDEIYKDHLPKLGERNAWRRGNKLMVVTDKDTLLHLQPDIGTGWKETLTEKIGEVGELERIDERGWLKMHYSDGVSWVVPPFLVKKSTPIQAQDRIQIDENLDMMKEIQHGHGGWSDRMKPCLGQKGTVEKVDDDGDVMVRVKGQKWMFHPAVLTLQEDGNEDHSDAKDDAKDDEKSNAHGFNNPPRAPEPDKRDKVSRLMERLTEKLQADEGGAFDKQIVRAAASGQQEKVRDLLKRNSKLANAKYNNRTPMQMASHEGFLQIVQDLVEANASLEEKDSDGDTALAYAVIGKNPSVVEYLLDQKAYANSSNKRRRTPLHISAHKGHQACAEALIKHGGSLNMQDDGGNLPLHLAIKQDSLSLIPSLVNHPTADLRLRNSHGFTPLHYAARKGSIEAVRAIIARDPALCAIEKDDGYTPLHVAVINNYIELTELLMQSCNCDQTRPGKMSPLHLATWQGHSEIVELLVEHGVSINCVDKDGDSPLHLAVHRRRRGKKFVRSTPTFEKLCQELRDPSITSARDALLAYLIRHGSDVTLKNDSGQKPLDAIRESELRRSLLKMAGVDVEETSQVTINERSTKAEERNHQNQKPSKPPTKKYGDAFEGIHLIDPKELELGETVGRGGFGEVKKALWRGTTVAVKLISTAGSKQSDVEKEIAIHKRARHPHIVSLMAVGHSIGQAHVVMEFIEGSDLYDLIFKKKQKRVLPLTSELKINIAVGLLSALTFLHASKILHLDIKPSNVMVEYASKRAYLCDLGLAHIKTRSSMTLSTSVRGPRGTITHMAPEMVLKEGKAWACPANDIWSIACTFLEMFVEERLWQGMEFMALLRTMLKPDTIPPILERASGDIKNILGPCFKKEPLDRPPAEILLKKFQALQKPPAP